MLDADVWAEVHQRGAPLACPECRGRMKACESVLGTEFFAHHRRPPDCSHGEGETETHRELKRLILGVVRALPGWTAEPEVWGSEGTRADVLATGPDGRPVVFEVQYSSIGGVTAVERSRRHITAGREVVWLSTSRRYALAGLPRVLIKRQEAAAVYVCGPEITAPTGEWVVVNHVKAFVVGGDELPMDPELLHGPPWWQTETVPLTAFIASVCHRTVEWGEAGRFWTTRKNLARWLAAKQRCAERAAAVQARTAAAEEQAAEIARRRAAQALADEKILRTATPQMWRAAFAAARRSPAHNQSLWAATHTER